MKDIMRQRAENKIYHMVNHYRKSSGWLYLFLAECGYHTRITKLSDAELADATIKLRKKLQEDKENARD